MILDGYKTYISAGLAFAAAAYEFFVANDPSKAYPYFVAGLGLAGIRNALPKKM